MAKVLLLGSRGRLGAALARVWSADHDVTALSRSDLDISRVEELEAALAGRHFEVLVNCTGATSLEVCEDDPALALRVNAEAPARLAEIAASRKARLIHFGTDYVFDGKKPAPYSENDPAFPLSVYGRTKLQGELAVVEASPRHLSVRVSWVFGPDKPSFVDMILQRAATASHVEAVADKTSSPTYTGDVAVWMSPFLSQELPGGLYHACNTGSCTWRDYGQEALDIAGRLGWPLQCRVVSPVPLDSMTAFRAPRPRHTVMDCSRLQQITSVPIRSWQESLASYLKGQRP
ncbi:MAG: dTDP-4-dehydrorhamnose reductase [Terrimicrobiaceae bacterium]